MIRHGKQQRDGVVRQQHSHHAHSGEQHASDPRIAT
jgi:hypothetical protein